jgi:hypothetical protein
MSNKNILIGLVGLGVLYALYMKNKKKPEANTTPKNFSPREPQMKENTIEEQRAFEIKFFKNLPDNFTLDNVYYFKNTNLEFYKQPFTPNSISGVQPIKISGYEFSNAYNKFKNIGQPSLFNIKK